MLQLLVVAVGNLCRQDSQRLDLGYNLGGHRVLSWGIFQQSLPLRDGIPPGASATTALETWSMGRWGRGERC